ncbi:MAG TPA: DinB family protein [Gemmatimonadaceae bacterium]|nr:DinB family protein [Gemmatimonadaceae bacterium]
MTSLASEIGYLLDYTEWDRAQWQAWFRSAGAEILLMDLGANGDGRFGNVGELVRHIFSAEQRYVDRIQDLPITDTSTVPADDVDRLFDFGRQSRQRLRDLVDTFPAERWELVREVEIASHMRRITPKTMIVQAVTHEIRHWAQLATLLRLAGRPTGIHDFLLSGVFERKLGRTSA